MATETTGIVGACFTYEQLMRIVTANASDSGVAFSPTTALFQPVCGKANGARARKPGEVHIPPRAMTRSAEVDGVDWGHSMQGVDQGRAGFIQTAAAGCDMRSSGTMTLLASYSRRGVRRVKMIAYGSRGEMAPEALWRFIA